MSISIPESATIDRQAAAEAARRRRERWKLAREFLRNRGAVVGAVLLVVFVVAAILSPMVIPYDPYKVDLRERLQPPSAAHWMGTDELGRDLLVRIGLGARYSLLIGLCATGIAALLGTILGLIGGYYGGRVGSVIMRSMDILLAFPGVLLAITIVAMLGIGLTNVVIAVGIHSIPAFARLAYGCCLTVKEEEYILAARAVGIGTPGILRRHVLPNILSPLIVQFSLRVATVILLAAGLGYLGLGAKPPTPEWGTMLSDSRAYMRTSAYLSFFPGLAICLLVLSLNLVGDGLRDVLDPRLRKL
jgi:peptide/nickel transport system permease protein